jgi:hypothetical protein
MISMMAPSMGMKAIGQEGILVASRTNRRWAAS